ncbi:MAG: amidohydrolase family protein [Candidatus Saccharimonas sp.]
MPGASESWAPGFPKRKLIDMIMDRGGWVNAHAHIDRANILNAENFTLVDGTLKQKWDYPDAYKQAVTVDQLYANMSTALDDMIAQNVQAVGTFIDVDPVIKDKAILAATRIKMDYHDKIQLRFINQVVKGVLEPSAREWFDVGAEFVDIIGGLPEKDQGREAEHLDVLFQTAQRLGKPLHVHIDQLNLPTQRDTELLVEKTLEYEYENNVAAIHAISLGSQPREYRYDLYKKLAHAGISVVSCPSGWLDNSWVAGLDQDTIGPIHNAVTPTKDMLREGVTVALGTDNIQDIYKPFSDGDMWSELRILLEANRLYDMEALANIASINGLRALFLDRK